MSFSREIIEVQESLIDGKYSLRQRLGSGTYGTVFKAEHSPLELYPLVYRGGDYPKDRSVALKLIHPHLVPFADASFVLRFLHAFKSIHALEHPNFLPILDFGIDGQFVYVAMPLSSGISLRELLLSTGPLRHDQVLSVLIPVCQALHQAHSQGLWHLGLSADNILIQRIGQEFDLVQVTDLGFAGLFGVSSKSLMIEELDGNVSVPRYVAPEQVFEKNLDARTDVYALGGILYDMLVAKAEFSEDLLLQTTMCHLNQYPILDKLFTPPTQLSEKLQNVVFKSLEAEPKRRFSSVEEFLSALIEAIEESSPAETLVRSRELLKPASESTSSEKKVAFPPWRSRERLIKSITRLLLLASLLFIIPLVIDRYQRLGENAIEDPTSALRRSVIGTRREIQDLFDKLERQRLQLDRVLSEQRAELAMLAGAPMSMDSIEGARRSREIEHGREVLRLREQQSEQLVNLVLNKSPEFISSRESFDEAEGRFRANEYEAASEAYARVAVELQVLLKRADSLRQSYDSRVLLSQAILQWKLSAPSPEAASLTNVFSEELVLAEGLLESGEFEQATAAFEALALMLTPHQAVTESKGTAAVSVEEDRQTPPESLPFSPRDLQTAKELYGQAQFAKAVPLLRRAVKDSDESLESRLLLAKSLYNLRRFGEAILEFREIIKSHPENSEAYYFLGNSYLFLDRFQDARINFEESLRIDSKNATGYLNLGVACERLQEKECAIKAYRDSLRYNPTEARAVSGLNRLGAKR